MERKQESENRSRRAPKGHFVVYVGDEKGRLVLSLSCLKNPGFQQLLQKAEEEFGFSNKNSIILPNDEFTFQVLSKVLSPHI